MCFAIQNREAHDENRVACNAIRISLEGVKTYFCMSNAVSSGTTNRPTVVHFVFPVAYLHDWKLNLPVEWWSIGVVFLFLLP